MNLQTQLFMGSFVNISELVYGVFLLLALIPMLIWLVISLRRWSIKRVFFKWWAITVGILVVLAIVIWTSVQVFAGVSYTSATLTHLYIPRSVVVLENDSDVGRNSVEHYIVVRFSDQSKMNSFIQSAKEKGWKSGNVVPLSLIHPLRNGENVMLGKTNQLPSTRQNGLYYSSSNSGTGQIKDGAFKGEQPHTIREAYFLNIKSMTLYLYYDDIVE